MTDTPLTPHEEDDALAAEYVLGVQDLPERLATAARVKSDTGFAALVNAWETHFAPLNEQFAETAAPMHILDAVEARLHPAPAKPKRNWLAWIGGPVAAGIVALVVAFSLPTPQGDVVAQLATEDRALVYQAAWENGELMVSRLAGSRPGAGQDHELWIIAPGAAPVSLGVLGNTDLHVPYPRPPVGWVLAVTVEPSGGSPTGAPTGPVILTAEIKA